MAGRVVIVGGGLSGLSLAFRLRGRRPDLRVTILERAGRVGGNVGTRKRDGYRVETGPNGFLDTKPSTLQLCRDLGLGDRLIAASEGSRKNRYLLIDGRLWALPSSLGSFLTSPLLSWRSKLRLMTEKYRKRPAGVPADETVHAIRDPAGEPGSCRRDRRCDGDGHPRRRPEVAQRGGGVPAAWPNSSTTSAA